MRRITLAGGPLEGVPLCRLLVLFLLLALSACEDSPRGPVADRPPEAPSDSASDSIGFESDLQPPPGDTLIVYAFFNRHGEIERVERRIPRTLGLLQAAMLELLKGPTVEEQRAGFSSFFSGRTAGLLRGVNIDAQGKATIDFGDLARVIPNASSSAGSQQLIAELNATVFQFPRVQAVEYRMRGSCQAFWEWLQRECAVVER